jgi:hypothetical protein
MVATLAVNKSSEPPGKYDVNSGQAWPPRAGVPGTVTTE